MAVHPPTDPKTEYVYQTPLTRFEAQRKLGLFAPLDYTAVLIICALWVTMGFWKLFGDPTVGQLCAFAVINIAIFQIWLAVLAYRCLVFILDVQADINLLPEAAARIVVGYWEGHGKGK